MQYEMKAKFISLHTYIGSIRTAAAVKPDAQKTKLLFLSFHGRLVSNATFREKMCRNRIRMDSTL